MKKDKDNENLDMMLENIYNSGSPCIFEFCSDQKDCYVRAEVIRMKKSKKLIALTGAVLLGIGGISAAYMRSEEDNSVIVEKKIQNYFNDTKTFEMDRSFNSNIMNMTACDDKLYFTAYVNDMNDTKKTALYDIGEKRLYELDMQTDGFIMSMYATDDYSYIFYINDVKSVSENRVCCIDNQTGESLYDKEIGFSGQVIQVTQNDEGRFMICGILQEGETSAYVCYEYDSQTFEEINYINITEKFSFDDDFINSYVVISDDCYYSFYENSEGRIDMQKISFEPDIVYLKEDICADMQGNFCGAVTASNGNPVIFSYHFNGESGHSFNELDKESGDVIFRYDDVLTESVGMSGYLDFSGKCDYEDSEYDFVYADTGVLYGYDLYEETRTEIADMNDPGDLGKKYASSGEMYYSNNKVLMEYIDDSESFSGEVLCVADMTGTILKTIPVALKNSENVIKLKSSDDNGVFVLISENTSENRYQLSYAFTLLQIDNGGNIVSRTPLKAYDDKLHNYNDFLIKDDKFVCMTIDHLSFFDRDGKYTGEINMNDTYFSQIFSGIDGDYVITVSGDSKSHIRKIDYENKKLELVSEFEYASYGELFEGDERSDFYISQSDGIYGYNIASKNFEEIINWVDSDLEKTPSLFTMNGRDTIICSDYDMTGTEINNVYTLLERADDETLKKIQNRKTITIACDSVPEIIMKKISEFNRANDEYRITLKEYNKYGNSLENNNVFDKLNMELIQGEIPDIIISDGSLDINRYTSLKMFADLNEFISGSELIKGEEYFDNIFKLYQSDGKQYQLPLTFQLNVMVGKKSVLEETGDLSFDDLYLLSEEKNLFYMKSQEDLLNELIKDNITEFVDFTDHSCDFTDSDFKNLLKVIKNNSSDEEIIDSASFKDNKNRFVNNSCVIDYTTLRDINSIINVEWETVGEECLFTGYPSSKKSKVMVSSGYIVGIAEKSPHKDIAWKFVETLLSEEVQRKIMKSSLDFSIAIPVNRAVFETENTIANGGNIETPSGKRIKLDITSEELRKRLKEIIKSSEKIKVTDTYINKIIDEQTGLYFSGVQDEEDTAKNIQKKVSLYLLEIK